RVVERVAEPYLACDLAGQQLNELLADGLVHEQTLRGGAALTGAEEAADARGIGGRGEVGVVHHDERPVAAHLEELRLAGRLARDDQPGLRRAGEGNGTRTGVDGELVAHLRARPEHEVEDAGWE